VKGMGGGRSLGEGGRGDKKTTRKGPLRLGKGKFSWREKMPGTEKLNGVRRTQKRT